MALVKRANVVLEVRDYEVERYKNEGYSIIDAAGNVIEETVPTDLKTLQQAYKKHKEYIKELEEKLKAVNEPKTSEKKPVEKEPVVTEKVAEEKPVKATGRRKKIAE